FALVFKPFITNRRCLHFYWSTGQLQFQVEGAILAYQMMFAESDLRNDQCQSVCTQIQRVALHPVDSSRSVQTFGDGNEGKTKAQANALPLGMAAVADILAQA